MDSVVFRELVLETADLALSESGKSAQLSIAVNRRYGGKVSQLNNG